MGHQPTSAKYQSHRLVIILLVFGAIAGLHSCLVPLTQGEDELAHYRYIRFIAQTGRLPASYAEREQAWYRADWPPFYHLLVGWAVRPLDTSQPHLKDVGESPRRRLVGQIFYPRLIIYTEDVAWPWQDGVLAWYIGRFMSLIFAGIALVFCYLTAYELAIYHPTIPGPPAFFATLTTALLAFTPRFMFTSAMLSDDSLFILLSAIFLWLLFRARRGDNRLWLYGVMGLLLGLSIVTKYSIGLFPLLMVPLIWWRRSATGWSWLQALSRLSLTWLFTLIGASWWFGWIGYYFNTIKEDGLVFGLLHPLLASGPDVSMRRIFAFFSGDTFNAPQRPAAIEAGNWLDWGVYLFQTFWGVPVLEQDPFFPLAYLVIGLGCLISALGLGRLWFNADRETRFTLMMLLCVVLLLLPFPLLRFGLTYNVFETGQGRHILYPAAQAIPLLLMWGWLWFIRQRVGERWLSVAGYLLPIGLLSWSIGQLGYMTVTYPEPLPVRTTTFDAAVIPQPVNHDFADGAIRLLGYELERPYPTGMPTGSRRSTNLTLFWQSRQQVEENYRIRLQLVDPAGHVDFTWLSHPVNGLYPTRAWDVGDIIRDELILPLMSLPPDTYNVQVDLLQEAMLTSLSESPFQLTQVDWPGQPWPTNAARLGDRLDYHWQIGSTPVRHRQTLGLTWQLSDQPQTDASEITWALIDPTGQAHPPLLTTGQTAIFIVGAAWPSGAYHLQADGPPLTDKLTTGPQFTIANDYRLFELPSLPASWVPVEANFANQVKLLGYSLPNRRVDPGGGLPITLYWQSLTPVLGDYVTFGVLLKDNQTAYGSVDRYPQGFYSPILWASGEVVKDEMVIPVKPTAPPGVYYLHVGQYYLAADSSVPNYLTIRQEGQPTDQTAIVIGPIKIGRLPDYPFIHQPNDITPQFTDKQTLAQQITLLGYDLTLSPEHHLALTLYWQADSWLTIDYTTFIHVRNQANETVAQKDNPPAQGRYPTSVWGPGEVIADQFTVSLNGLPAGQYIPVVGLYDPTTGQRLLVPGNPANEISLSAITLP